MRRIKKNFVKPVWRDIMNLRGQRVKDRKCSECDTMIDRRNQSGLCMKHNALKNGMNFTNDNPAYKKKNREASIQRWLGDKNPNKTPENRRKKRMLALEQRKNMGVKSKPFYNPKSISIIEDYGKEHGYNFQHAENGGEVQVLGYFLDGYDKENNVVIEYMEKHHKRRVKQDTIRKKEITEHLNCKYIEIWEKK